MVRRVIIYLTIFSFILASCGSPPPAQPVGGSGAAPSAGQPAWITDAYARYNRQEYLAVVGSGSSRQAAERDALSNLVAQFGQGIQVDERISTTYQEAVRGSGTGRGAANWSEVTNAETIIALTTGMDSLIGAEIGEAWVDPRGTHYVAAILNRSRAARVYTDMVRANLAMIETLTKIPDAEKYTLDGFARFQFAAVIADVNVTYGNLLGQIGAPFPGISNGDALRLEVTAITRAIPVRLAVTKQAQVDQAGRIETAFARALSNLGFQSGGNNSRYVLDVDITLTPVTIANNANFWSRIEVNANLTDTETRTVLLPFNFNSREGHTSQSEADNRTIIAAERRINDDYARELSNYLSRMLP